MNGKMGLLGPIVKAGEKNECYWSGPAVAPHLLKGVYPAWRAGPCQTISKFHPMGIGGVPETAYS